MGTTTTTILTTTTSKFLVNRGRKKQQQKEVPKGCLAVKVGEAGGEQQRFVVPVIWFNHPLFMQLLKEAEDEYGFEQKGTITIPCNVKHFCNIISCIMIDHRGQQQYSGCFSVRAG